jgi:hypothetical protein
MDYERKRVVKGLDCGLCGLWDVDYGLLIVEEVIWGAGGEGLNVDLGWWIVEEVIWGAGGEGLNQRDV